MLYKNHLNNTRNLKRKDSYTQKLHIKNNLFTYSKTKTNEQQLDIQLISHPKHFHYFGFIFYIPAFIVLAYLALN